MMICIVLLFLLGWFEPWFWFFPSLYSSWVYLILSVVELLGALSSCWFTFSSVSFWSHLELWVVFLVQLSFYLTSLGMLCLLFVKLKKNLNFLISSLTMWLLSRVLFSFPVYVWFLFILLLLKSSLSPWWSDRIHGIISIFFLLRPVLRLIKWSVLNKEWWGA